jgi:hypothetical protein
VGSLKSAEGMPPRPVHRLDEPTRLSLGVVASPQSPLPFRLAKVILPQVRLLAVPIKEIQLAR